MPVRSRPVRGHYPSTNSGRQTPVPSGGRCQAVILRGKPATRSGNRHHLGAAEICRENPMHCPFCRQTIDIEFRPGGWIAVRDGADHACSGLAQALSAASDSRPSNGSGAAPRQISETDRPIATAPPLAAGNTAVKTTTTPTGARRKTGTRSGLRRLPVQLELQAIE